MSRCRWFTDESTGGRYDVPGCWDSAVYGPAACTCSGRSVDEILDLAPDPLDLILKRLDKIEATIQAALNEDGDG